MDAQQYRLRVDDIRVSHDVAETQVQLLAVVTKAEAHAWLDEQGTPAEDPPQGVVADEEEPRRAARTDLIASRTPRTSGTRVRYGVGDDLRARVSRLNVGRSRKTWCCTSCRERHMACLVRTASTAAWRKR
jgi:hypothetical protein